MQKLTTRMSVTCESQKGGHTIDFVARPGVAAKNICPVRLLVKALRLTQTLQFRLLVAVSCVLGLPCFQTPMNQLHVCKYPGF